MMKSLLRPIARFVRRLTGLKAQHLKIPYAWVPYHLYDDGTAWAPLTVTSACSTKPSPVTAEHSR
jgi:hypothetical protein